MAPMPILEKAGQQRKDAVGRQRHQDADHFHDHGFEITKKAGDASALLPRMGNGVTEQQCEYDDLQHLAVGHSPYRV
jgi:hypothetical protein